MMLSQSERISTNHATFRAASISKQRRTAHASSLLPTTHTCTRTHAF
jgi:hypothetical protein